MADYSQMSDSELLALVNKGKGGDTLVPPPELETAKIAKGAAKAIGSGLLHEGVPSIVGMPGDVHGLMQQGGLWAGEKLRGMFGDADKTDAPVPSTPMPAEPVDRTTNPAAEAKYLKEVDAWRKQQPIPAPDPAVTKFVEKNATKITDPLGMMLPTSEGVRSAITKAVPEYEPQNLLERGLKTTAGFAPAALAAPETSAPGLAAKALSGATSLGRYAALPGFASEGVRDLPFVKGSPVEEPLSMAAALAGQKFGTKMITPQPASAARIADSAVLGRGVGTPSQVAGSEKGMNLEARTAGAFLGPGVETINRKNLEGFTEGTLRKGVGIEGANAATPDVRRRMNKEIDDKFTDLTKQHKVPMDAELKKKLGTAVSDYNKGALLTKSDEPAKMLDKINDIFKNTYQDQKLRAAMVRRGLPPLKEGFIDGRTYQNLRSELGNLSVDATNSTLAKVYRDMRDALDTKMEHAVRHFGPPDDIGQFQDVRQKYQNKLIIDRALRGQDPAAAEGLITPKKLGAASQHILGDEYGLEQHPLAEHARAGQRILKPLEKQEPKESMMHLATILAGGAGLGTAIGGQAQEKHDNPYGYLLGGAAGMVGTPMLAALMHSRPGTAWRGNQVLPRAAQPRMVQDPANALLMAEALAKSRRSPAEQP